MHFSGAEDINSINDEDKVMDEEKGLISKEEENRLVILVSIEDIGGYGTKKKVLDNIRDKKYLNLTPEDLKMIPIGESNNELKWRNKLAWVRRFPLVIEGYISNVKRNEWRITPKGISYLHETIAKIIKSKQSKFNRLTNVFYDRINKKL